jgi:hypothetical protein
MNVPRRGGHWQDIGFQGDDPATDLRSVGMLGLLQMLAFLETNQQLVIQINQVGAVSS